MLCHVQITVRVPRDADTAIIGNACHEAATTVVALEMRHVCTAGLRTLHIRDPAHGSRILELSL
jgi:hypothetical protein